VLVCLKARCAWKTHAAPNVATIGGLPLFCVPTDEVSRGRNIDHRANAASVSEPFCRHRSGPRVRLRCERPTARAAPLQHCSLFVCMRTITFRFNGCSHNALARITRSEQPEWKMLSALIVIVACGAEAPQAVTASRTPALPTGYADEECPRRFLLRLIMP
jgi:hypothetical protein